MTAALVGAIQGLRVVLLEKSLQLGGTSATSAGTAWIPGTSRAAECGHADSIEAAYTYLQSFTGDNSAQINTLQRTFLETGDEAVRYLASHSEVQLEPAAHHPDYRGDAPGAVESGRALVTPDFDGRKLRSDDFSLVKPPRPEMMILGGMMIAKEDIQPLLDAFRKPSGFIYAAKLLFRYLSDRLFYSRGTRLVLGNAMVARLLFSLRQRGVEIRTGVAVRELLTEGRKVVGVRCITGGNLIDIPAASGVVLATGGFAGSPAWRRRFLEVGAQVRGLVDGGCAGDGIELALAVGGALGESHAGAGFYMPMSTLRTPAGTTKTFPHIYLDRAKPGLLAVNSEAERFVNEADSYHDFVLGMLKANRSVPTIPAYLICDSAFLKDYGLGLVRPRSWSVGYYIRSGYLKCADTIEGLAHQIGVPAEKFSDTVRRYNDFAAIGIDADFGRGRSPLNRHNGDPRNTPNPCLRPICRPPFYAVAVEPAALATSLGLSTDRDARVLDPSGTVVEGLYACGNDMNSIMAGHYPGPGVTLGPAIVFAYRAARHASEVFGCAKLESLHLL
uniref:Fumarate reductase/succinate dehydrogenase flavoprotein-like protein n=1 Tax=Chelativorans sp. (strain BNC1) TaxID=266779 RepID=Q11FZ5_CHESB